VLGQEIRKARIAAGLTQEELAFKAGVARNYVSLLELDRKSPTFKVLVNLCRAMSVRTSVIVARVENRSGKSNSNR
jgi:transcriptional regulator with XRE-family HTH domain